MARWPAVSRGAAAGGHAAPGPAYAGLVLCVSLWGMVFIAVAELLPDLDAVQIVTIRFALVALVCAAVLALLPSQRPSFSRNDWARVVGCGVLAVPGAQYVIVQAQNYLSPSLTALIVTLSPAFTAVLASILLRARLGSVEKLGFVLAMVGVALVLVFGSGTGSAVADAKPLAAAIGVISPIAWAGYTLAVAPLSTRHPPVGVVCWVFIAGAVATLPAYPHAAEALGSLDGADWAWLAGLAVPATTLPNLLWIQSLRRLPVHRTSAFMYLVPVFATLWAALFLARAPEAIVVPGGVLVLVGVFLAQGRRPRGSDDPVAAGEATAGPAT